MEKFNFNEEIKINHDISILLTFLLDSIVNSIGHYIDHFAVGNHERIYSVSSFPPINQTIGVELLKHLINIYPSLIINLLNYKVSNKIIEKYSLFFPHLQEQFQSKINNNNMNIIDFLFITYAYNGGTSQQILIILISTNYFYQYIDFDGFKYLSGSSILWRYEIFSRIIDESKRIVESKMVLKDLNYFMQLHQLHILTLNLLLKCKGFYIGLLNYEEILIQQLYELCMISLRTFNDDVYMSLLQIDGVFYVLCKKIHNRLIKLSICIKSRNNYESKHMKYYKYII